MTSEYWIISIPKDNGAQETFNAMNDVTHKQHNLCSNYMFTIPELKVGTLDQLVGLSDDLSRLDLFVEQVTRKVATYLGDVLEDKGKLHESLQVNNSSLVTYMTTFNWDSAKYPTKQSLRQIADVISKHVGSIEVELKQKSTTYNNLKGNLQNLTKKQTGSLLTRNLAELVKKEHFVLDSEYLTTLLVIVPKHLFNDWYAQYSMISEMVVPESSILITHDHDYGLFNVTLFKKVVEEFKLHARERRFIVRDFTYNENDIESGRNEINKLVTDQKKQFGPLVRWLKVNFSECFSAWIHVKALRVFIESVLRYGLPVNFVAILILPNKKSNKRLRDVLNNLFGHLDGSGGFHNSSKNIDNVDIPGLSFGQSEYFPYVCYKINIDMIEHKN